MAEAKLKYDDVNEGDVAPSLTHKLTRTDLVQYAGASGDDNPLHTVSHRDKRLMKQLVRTVGVPTAEFRSLPDAADTEAVAANRERIGAGLGRRRDRQQCDHYAKRSRKPLHRRLPQYRDDLTQRNRG